MIITNALGQMLEIGDCVTHTTASQDAHISMGFIRGFHVAERYSHKEQKVDVVWVYHGWNGTLDCPKKASVRPRTVSKIDRGTLGRELQTKLRDAKAEYFKDAR